MIPAVDLAQTTVTNTLIEFILIAIVQPGIFDCKWFLRRICFHAIVFSSQFRRHKSASPSRRKSVPPPNQCGCHHHHQHYDTATLHRHHHHVHHMSATLRSKSTGQLLDDHHIRGSTRSRSRSKSKMDCNECCSNEHLDTRRGDRSSTRSTRWEVYRHVDSPKKSHNSSQRRKSPIYKVDPLIPTHYFV